MEVSDEDVSQFMAVTGSSDANQARSYLEMSGGNLETAVSLFLEHQGGGGGGSTGFGSTTDSHINPSTGEVRAPDQTQRLRLLDYDDSAATAMGANMMDHPFYGNARMMGGMGGSMMLNPHRMMGAFADDSNIDMNENLGSLRDVINRSANMDTETQIGDEDTTAAAAPRGRATRLADMFSPPLHLIHSAGGFQGARNFAKDSKRWLLVNLQSDSEFACHALNRDVWRDELCENLVREGFIFWQTDDQTDDGRTYCQRYNVNAFPHIGIIDPRTGRLMYKKEGWTQENPLTPVAFAELAADFCSRHSLDKAPEAPKTSRNASLGSNASGNTTKREMTEEEQLQAAIRASMNEANQNDEYDDDSVEYVMDDDDDDDDEIIIDDMNESVVMEDAVAEEKKEPTFIEEIVEMNVGDEPSENAARVMIRMPDGKRLVRKFKLDDSMKVIYAFVAQSNDDAKGGKEFVMKAGFPPRDLISSVDDTIANAGVSGDSITVRWKED